MKVMISLRNRSFINSPGRLYAQTLFQLNANHPAAAALSGLFFFMKHFAVGRQGHRDTYTSKPYTRREETNSNTDNTVALHTMITN